MSSLPRRVTPCPRSGCPEWALLASRVEIGRGGHIWRCPAGHRGPHIVGLDLPEPHPA